MSHAYHGDIKKIEKKFFKFLWKHILSILIGIFILYVLFFKVGIPSIKQYASLLPISIIIAVFAIYALIYLLQITKWYIIISENSKVSFLKLIPIYFAGGMFNQLTPGATCGGQPYRAYHLSKLNDRDFAQNLSTSIFDFSTLAILHSIVLLFSLVYLFFFKFPLQYFIFLLFLAFIIIAFFLTVTIGLVKLEHQHNIVLKILPLIYHFHLFKAIKKKFSTYRKIKSYVLVEMKMFYHELRVAFKNRPLFIKAFSFDIIIFFFYILQYFILFQALNIDINFIIIIIVFSISQLVNFLMFTPGGVGIVEAIMVGIYSLFSIPAAASLTVTAINRFFLYIYEFLIGYISFIYLKKD
tara:strand:+ start:206 stop:1267 length:1062 start_codon:yes stop_codon:yes gene_type:complete